MESRFDCRACGQQALLLGVRWDRPHRWRPWIIRGTPLYLCTRCDVVVALAAAENRRRPWAAEGGLPAWGRQSPRPAAS